MLIGCGQFLDSFFKTCTGWRFILLRDWDTIVGSLAQHMRLERIDEDVLVIGVYDVIWMQELYLLSNTIMRTINNALGQRYINKVRFKLVSRPAELPLQRQIKHHAKDPVAPKELNTKEYKALEDIKDPELKNAIYAFLLRTEHGDKE